MTESPITILLPELHVRYMHIMDKISFGNRARNAIEAVDRKIEVHFSMNSYFDHDWNIVDSEVESFVNDHKKGIIKNGGAYHGFIGIAPPGKPENLIRLGNIHEYDKNLVALKGQIRLSRRLSDECGVEQAILVVHLDSSVCPKDESESGVKIKQMFNEVASLANELRVHISIEIEIASDYFNCYGSSFANLADVVRSVNSRTTEEGLEPFLGITYDFSHAIINFLGDFSKARKVIDKYGDLITYAHINHPRKFPIKKPIPHSKKMPTGFLHNIRSGFLALTSPDIHARIYDVDKEEESHDFIRLLVEKTRIRETGIINLELSPKLTYAYRAFTSGASANETIKSVETLNSIINPS